MVAGRTRTLSHQYYIAARPARVARAFSEADELTKWLCDRAEIVAERGGRYELQWVPGPTHAGRIVRFTPGRRIVFEWSWEGVRVPPTEFELAVRAKGRGALLEVTHRGFPRGEKWTELYAGAEWGWTYFAMNLKSVLETGRDLRSRFDG